ncbi:GSCOCG00008429001-RA-CDS [Cotesia congregata]|uniref:Similar to ANK2: Ankyrin-2 (Homo sapiens) n=1 Tax=Cotesia congregata TaxID=51543 RepID=A0A8J2HFP9_COTCN|nr:GSCOCG00008429001-RA-CDS [Cotesia congregata]CAG5099911.1 Similar to ANK2: Ankyrin-2 (Homo sapiens) [Cotesia congregata]
MTAACTDETLLCQQIITTSSNNSTFFEVQKNDLDKKLFTDNSNSDSNNTRKSLANGEDKIERATVDVDVEPCTRQLDIYLESRGIRTWDEHEYTCIGEAASSSSLESTSHELISEGNSSGYNSSGIDDKSKRDSDSISTSSRSDSGEMNCVASLITNSIKDIENSVNKVTLNDIELKKDKVKRKIINVSKKCARKEIDHEGIEMFHEAVRIGDASKVEELVTYGLIDDLDEPDWNVSGDPPLLVAASNHSLPVLGILLASGCDAGARSPRGETALHRAILNGGPGNVKEFVKELLENGCSPSVKEAGGGLTALHILARQLAHMQPSRSLHYNFEEALETLSILAKAGAVNDKDHQGRSALHILASSTILDSNNKKEIELLIKILLEAGADPTLKNDRGETALHESLEYGALNTADILMPHTPTGIISRYGETPLHIAARKNHTEVVGKLLKNGEDPSIQDAGGNTCLHLASARGFHQIVSLIVTSPLAQLEKVNDEGLTALQVAAESGFVNAVKILLKAGANPALITSNCSVLRRHPDISIIINHELTKRRQLAT